MTRTLVTRRSVNIVTPQAGRNNPAVHLVHPTPGTNRVVTPPNVSGDLFSHSPPSSDNSLLFKFDLHAIQKSPSPTPHPAGSRSSSPHPSVRTPKPNEDWKASLYSFIRMSDKYINKSQLENNVSVFIEAIQSNLLFQDFRSESELSVIGSLDAVLRKSLEIDSPGKLKERILLLHMFREAFLFGQPNGSMSYQEAKILLRFFKGEMCSMVDSDFELQVQDLTMFVLSGTDTPILRAFLDHILGQDREFWFKERFNYIQTTFANSSSEDEESLGWKAVMTRFSDVLIETKGLCRIVRFYVLGYMVTHMFMLETGEEDSVRIPESSGSEELLLYLVELLPLLIPGYETSTWKDGTEGVVGLEDYLQVCCFLYLQISFEQQILNRWHVDFTLLPNEDITLYFEICFLASIGKIRNSNIWKTKEPTPGNSVMARAGVNQLYSSLLGAMYGNLTNMRQLDIHNLGISAIRGTIYCMKVRSQFEFNFSSNTDNSEFLKNRMERFTVVEGWILKDLESERFSFLHAVTIVGEDSYLKF